MILRPRQIGAVEGVFEQWKTVSSTLGVAATGFGKTQIFCEIVKRVAPARCLILCHRTELVDQAVKRLKSFGMEAEIEKAELHASHSLWNRAPVVVATPQTLFSGKEGHERMMRFLPKDFGYLIVDEAHRYVAPTYLKVINYFRQNENLKVLGVTATPDRLDCEALSKIFESVAFDVEICDLIDDGWLVPIKQQMVKIEGLDFSACRTTAGDLNGSDLIAVMEQEKNLHGVASATLDIAKDQRTLVFAAGVKQAEILSEIFNRHRSDCSNVISAKTHPQIRKEMLESFATGKTQIMVNVGVLIEGYDNPNIQAVVSAAPTKSRSKYAQLVGRGTRPLDGILAGLETSDERKAAIAASSKPALLVVDFSGNAGRHKLINTSDILGGKISEEAKEIAIKRIEEKGGAANIRDEIALAEEEIIRRIEEQRKANAARKAHLKAIATYRATYIDPFDSFKKTAEKWQGWKQKTPLTEKQRKILVQKGFNPDKMSVEEGSATLQKIFACSDKQANILIRAGYSPEELKGIKKWEASKMIEACKANGWKRPKSKLEAQLASVDSIDDSIPF